MRIASSGALAALLIGCSGSGATNLSASEDGGDGSTQPSDAATGGDATGADGGAGADGSTGSDGAMGPDGATGPDGAMAPDGATDTDAAIDGAEDVTASDGNSDGSASDGAIDAPASGDGPNDSTVADASADVIGVEAAPNDAPSEAPVVDATTGDASTADATVGDATSPDAVAPDVDVPVTDAGTDAPSDSAFAAEVAPDDAMSCNNADEAGGASCNSLCNTAPVLPVFYSTQPPPVATGGGAPPPGLYYVTAITYYFQPDAGVDAGLSGGTFQETAIFSNAGFVYLGESIVSQNGVSQGAVDFQLVGDGTNVLFTQTCPTADQETVPYSRSGDTFTVYISNGYEAGGYIAAATLTLQTPYDGGAPDAGLPDAGNCSDPDAEAGSTCTSICNTASPIVPVAVAADAPAPTGGPVADGTYYLTARNVYLGVDGGTDAGVIGPEQETLVVATTPDGIRIVQYVQSGGSQPASVSTVLASGDTLYFTALCPFQGQNKKKYSSIGNSMIVYDTDGPGAAIEGSVYTLQ